FECRCFPRLLQAVPRSGQTISQLRPSCGACDTPLDLQHSPERVVQFDYNRTATQTLYATANILQTLHMRGLARIIIKLSSTFLRAVLDHVDTKLRAFDANICG